ncbi:GDSL esterase/lipase At1g28580 [Linum grandiflorum]
MAAAAAASTLVFLTLATAVVHSSNAGRVPCFTSLFSFGDSITDTGNQMLLPLPEDLSLLHCCFPPYGETYFGRPTGRCSDGRLIVDFIARQLGLPLLRPYPGMLTSPSFQMGANFAMAAATVLDFDTLANHGILSKTDVSLQVEIDKFKELLATICSTPSECKQYLSKSLILLGEIGGNDYNRAFLEDVPIDKIFEVAPHVVGKIGRTIEDLIELGAMTILVPGNFPVGCSPIYLTRFPSSNKEDYDSLSGCLIRYNNFTQHHNSLLQKEILRLRELYPSTNIMYADYYNSAIRFFQYPEKFGISGSGLVACCGGGGPYNYNSSLVCGNPGCVACKDPSAYVYWDDHHFTESTYKKVVKDVLEGSFSIPRFNASCIWERASDNDGHSMY